MPTGGIIEGMRIAPTTDTPLVPPDAVIVVTSTSGPRHRVGPTVPALSTAQAALGVGLVTPARWRGPLVEVMAITASGGTRGVRVMGAILVPSVIPPVGTPAENTHHCKCGCVSSWLKHTHRFRELVKLLK